MQNIVRSIYSELLRDAHQTKDSISRNLLQASLLKCGVKGKLLRAIKAMYENVK